MNMQDILLWIYIINATLLINHEIDSAYWHEWELFKLPGGVAGFLLMHFPLLLLVLYGLVLVAQGTLAGLTISLILSLSGLFAFSIHTYFIRRGRDEFNTPMSLFILRATLVVSLIQAVLSIMLIAQV
jgi:hypothetical protein